LGDPQPVLEAPPSSASGPLVIGRPLFFIARHLPSRPCEAPLFVLARPPSLSLRGTKCRSNPIFSLPCAMILNILPLDEKGEAVVAFAAPVIAPHFPSRPCETPPFSLRGPLFSSLRGPSLFAIARPPLLVIARHEVPKQSHLFTQLHRDPWNASTLTKSESGCRNGNF